LVNFLQTITFEIYQIEFEAIHGESELGYVAIDAIILERNDVCQFTPTHAWPESSTTTSTTPVTEKPSSKL